MPAYGLTSRRERTSLPPAADRARVPGTAVKQLRFFRAVRISVSNRLNSSLTDSPHSSMPLADYPAARYTGRKPKFRMLCGSI